MSQPDSSKSSAPAHELAKAYVPAEHEPRIRARWESSRAFHADPSRVLRGEAKPYCIFIPPPNVTDRLHLGHALNNTLQDVLARAHRMMGFETLWMPGTDHAGIATQAVVEKRLLASEGKKRTEFTRDEFVAKVQAFKDEYERVITGQIKAMGSSCDFDRQRFTMDPQCARAVYEAFFRLFRDGLIYRGKRLVNWDPVLQTAVADDECYDAEVDGQFYYLRYPLVHETEAGPVPATWGEIRSSGWKPTTEPEANLGDDAAAWITVATTRPETYLGDTAVAMNPKDPRAAALRGLCVQLPLVGRVIPIIEDDYVVLPAALQADAEAAAKDPKAQFATGFLKVTPAHDANDHALWERHLNRFKHLPNAGRINILAPDATISDQHGWTDIGDARVFVGLSREIARKRVITEFAARATRDGVSLSAGAKPYRHSVPHSDRSKAAIEPYLSDQWYVKVTDPRMAQAANDALTPSSESAGRERAQLAFFPERYAKTYQLWHDNIRDWCISRQLWWGHRIPVWSGPSSTNVAALKDSKALSTRLHGDRVFVALADPTNATLIAGLESLGLERDPDVLDTWFSSALWPLSTLGWPDDTELLRAFNPSSVLSTAREIITLWVSRMVMFNRYLLGQDRGPADGSGAGRGPVPFRDVFIHAVIQDSHGQRMSKSLGNGVDPLDIISSHGSDAMRFTLCQMTTQTQDVRVPVDLVCPHTGDVFPPKFIVGKGGYTVPAPIQTNPKDPKRTMVTGYGVASGLAKPTAETPLAKNTSAKFDAGRNFCNKLWNAVRFALGMLSDAPHVEVMHNSQLSLADRWMLSRLATAAAAVDRSLANYEFSEYAGAMYDLLWRDFCDWYLEAIKPSVASDAGARAVLRATLEAIVRLLHPIAPYVTEAVYERLAALPLPRIEGITLAPSRAGLVCLAGWPSIDATWHSGQHEREFEAVQALVTAIREVRAQHKVSPKREVVLHMPPLLRNTIRPNDLLIQTLARVGVITDTPPTGASVAFTLAAIECRLSNLADAVDPSAERARFEKSAADAERTIATLESRLANPSYADKAPPAMVEQTRGQLAKAKHELEHARAALKALP